MFTCMLAKHSARESRTAASAACLAVPGRGWQQQELFCWGGDGTLRLWGLVPGEVCRGG